jgi:methionyl-tRNA formyltransferase
VFSILNKLPAGATIHEMDEEIDHGGIIDQSPVHVDAWDTSLEVYNKILEAEMRLVRKNLVSIVEGTYSVRPPSQEGNYNSIDDFKCLLELDMSEQLTMSAFIDRMRALTHGDFKNAYFVDPETGKKIFIKIKLDPE